MNIGKRNLERAFEQASQGWFPPNPEVFEKVKKVVEPPRVGRSEIKELLSLVRSDFSLYGYCLTQLAARGVEVWRGDLSEYALEKPILMFHANEVIDILRSMPPSLSLHSFGSLSADHSQRIKETILSTSTASVMGPKLDVHSDLAFNAAFFRQLGLTLLSWNFPRVFAKSITALKKSGVSLEKTFLSEMGFSPIELGVSFAERSAMPMTIVHSLYECDSIALDKFVKESRKPSSKSSSRALATVCNAGEALARAQSPEMYPSAKKDFNTVVKISEQVLGESGLIEIFNAAQKVSEVFEELVPSLRSIQETQQRLGSETSSYGMMRREKNVHLKLLDGAFEDAFAELYTSLSENTVAEESLKGLLVNLLPKFGFGNSAILMNDRQRLKLVPVMRRGTPTFIRLRPIDLVALSEMSLAREAFSARNPLTDVGRTAAGETVRFIVGVLGEKSRSGVMYLETNRTSFITDEQKAIDFFQAVVTCVCDMLHLE